MRAVRLEGSSALSLIARAHTRPRAAERSVVQLGAQKVGLTHVLLRGPAHAHASIVAARRTRWVDCAAADLQVVAWQGSVGPFNVAGHVGVG